MRVGVFGSLHSSSRPTDVREYSFYLPDYFDEVAFAHPAVLTAFQELNLSYDERDRGFFQLWIQFDSYAGPDTASVARKSVDLADLGLGFMAHEDGVNCTAQHVPEGSVWLYGKDVRGGGISRRDAISTLDVAPSILSFFGREKPRYMRGNSSIRLHS